jgi:diguanylate cyclase (GGDEF)-like protein
MFAHDEVYLVDGHDRPVQAVVNGKRVPTQRFWLLRREFDQLMHSVRGDVRVAGRHDRIPPHPMNPKATVRTTSRAVHDTHIMLIGGRPAAASAMLIKPSTAGYVQPRGQWPILISVRYLDGSFLGELEARELIDAPRFSRTAQSGADEHSLELHTEWNEPLGYLHWKPELPGSSIMQTLLPATLLALLLVAAVIWALIRNLKQTLFERSAFEARAAHFAYHDSLTGLPNRTLLNERLGEALDQATPDHPVILLLIDLDRFKQVNDTLGHLAGDELIREFASRLVGIARPGDTVARLGGDEFAVVLRDTQEAEVAGRCQQILDLFTAPFELMTNQVFGGASIGAASCVGIAGATELMRRADVALYRAKAEGRNCARLHQPAMDDGAKRRTQLESDLRLALMSETLSLWAQPIVSRDEEVVGQELLLRWRHPTLGMISPEQVIPLAEETGLIVPIGEWVMRQAAYVVSLHPGLTTALNLSPVQLRDKEFVQRAIDIFRQAGADPTSVELEITERILLDDSRMIRASLAKLRSAGFRVALDDFGTGYSSLSYLRRFAVDKIKIDRSFVADVHSSAEARAIIAAIVALARALGLTVAAEGVETRLHADVLIGAGCDQLQGYYFGRPSPIDLPAEEPVERGEAA